MSMSSEESERIAICCVLLDIVEAMGTSADIKGCRHYQSLRDKTDITDSDFEGARSVSVLSSLVTLKGMHYNKKMLLALTVCDLYSGHTPVSIHVWMIHIVFSCRISILITISQYEKTLCIRV